MAIERYLNEPVREKPEDVLRYLVARYEIASDVPAQDAFVAVFARAIQALDPAAGGKYLQTQAIAGFREFAQTGDLPGYVKVAYKTLKKQDEFRVPKPIQKGPEFQTPESDKKEA